MVKSNVARPSIAEICRSSGLTLADLAHASGVSLPSIKQLEQNPPRKKRTWRKWQRRIACWIPLLGHAFPDVLEGKAFWTCPHESIEVLLSIYYNWANTLNEQESINTRRAIALEREFLDQAAELDAKGDWDKAEIWIARAARLFPRSYPRWAYHRFTIAQLQVNKGELDSAEQLMNETIAQHQNAFVRAGGDWDPNSLALAEATHAWSCFLRGEWQASKAGFDQTIVLARSGQDRDLIHRGSHMGARALAEPHVIRAYFSRNAGDRQLDPRVVGWSIKGLRAALDLDEPGSPTQAFGLWYEGVLLGLSGDVADGGRLLIHAESQLRANGMVTAALSHARLSRIHFDILSTAWDVETFRRCELELRDMLPYLLIEKFPYAYADALTTLAYCRLQQPTLLGSTNERKETADLLCLALTAHPYPQHELWQVGKHFLTEIVMPAFAEKERVDYSHTLRDRAHTGEGSFDYLLKWRFDLGPMDTLLRLLSHG